MANEKFKLGKLGETIAQQFLEERGFTLIEKNYSITSVLTGKKIGEIDLIMLDEKEIVFVEVRTKTNAEPVGPLDTITRSKRRQIEKCAKIYLEFKNITNRYARFDLVGITHNKDLTEPKIDYIKNAFACGD
jgi:putative endonuclease